MLIVAIYYFTAITIHVGNIGRMSLEFVLKSVNLPKDGWMYVKSFLH